MLQLGISAFYHDSAACIVKNGKVLCAIEEERFTEIKHDASFPVNSIILMKFVGTKIRKLKKIELPQYLIKDSLEHFITE